MKCKIIYNKKPKGIMIKFHSRILINSYVFVYKTVESMMKDAPKNLVDCLASVKHISSYRQQMMCQHLQMLLGFPRSVDRMILTFELPERDEGEGISFEDISNQEMVAIANEMLEAMNTYTPSITGSPEWPRR